LEQRGWPVRTDAGWSEYDLELYGSRFANLHLTTVVEAHPRDRSLIRSRLTGRWSLTARVAFWSVLGVELVLIGALGPAQFWPWLLLLTVPAWIWLQRREARRVQSVTIVLLDELAKERRLTRVGQSACDSPAVPDTKKP
jgi:hypothetical protein